MTQHCSSKQEIKMSLHHAVKQILKNKKETFW